MNQNSVELEMESLDGLIILITGANAGIGRALTLDLAHRGATCLMLGRNVTGLEALYDEIMAAGDPEPAIIPFDLSQPNPERIVELVSAINDQYGHLDGLIHNAAILGERVPFQQYKLSTWSEVFRVNFDAPVALTQALLPLLQKPKASSLLFVSSSVGKAPRAYWGAYANSKYALEGFAALLSDELANTTNIRISVVNPGATRTNMRKAAYPAENPASVKAPDALLPLMRHLIAPSSSAPRGYRFDSNGNFEPLVAE